VKGAAGIFLVGLAVGAFAAIVAQRFRVVVMEEEVDALIRRLEGEVEELGRRVSSAETLQARA